MSTELPEKQGELAILRPIANPKQILEQQAEFAGLIKEVLKEGVDYGKIPGTKKNTLYKPGAERLCIAFGAGPHYELIDKEVDHEKVVAWQKKQKVWNNKHQNDKTFRWETESGESVGLYRYVYKCKVVRSDGRILGEGEGVCSTMESKYVDRPRDTENTVLKMAQKRAFIAATLNSFGLSSRFSEDPADSGSVSIYTGTDDQKSKVTEYLKKNKIPQDHWDAIHIAMKGKPSTTLASVVQEIVNGVPDYAG